ncbi:MAG: Fe-S cluster assembly protein SufD [Thermoanaerobaculia bacterium]
MKSASARRAGVDGFLARGEQLLQSEGARAPLFLRRLRETGLAAFGRLGFPAADDEEWRYTNVGPIAEGAFTAAPAAISPRERAEERGLVLGLDGRLGPVAFSDRKKTQIVFVNGRYSPEWSSIASLPDGVLFQPLSTALERQAHLVEEHLGRSARPDDHPFVALNTAEIRDGVLLHVPRGATAATPLWVYWVTTGAPSPALATAPRTLAILGEHAEARLVEAFVGSGGTAFVNAVTEATLGAGAHLDYVTLQREGPETLHIGNLRVVQAEGSQSRTHLFSFGGALVRNELAVLLDGEGAGTALNGLYCVSGAQHVDNHTLIDHRRPHGTSLEFYKGILDGSARGAFDGRIVVRPSARATDARQTNRNLVLSDTARVDSKPQLEIYNNDVKCTHGSTTGRLDETMLFYLRSRGLGEAEARSLLTFAFGSELAERVVESDLRAYLEASLLSWLSHPSRPPEGA